MSDPRISIIVPGTDAPGVDHTLRSLDEQRYPALEILWEQDDGIGAALNRGFARATGEIHAFLPAGDRLLPGTLQRVAKEIAPASGRNVILGGTFLEIEGVEEVAAEQCAGFGGIEEHLRIWERGFDVLAYGSLFWHRGVRDAIGLFDPEAEAAIAAYELGCRIGVRHVIHNLDEALSVTRIAARAGARGEHEALADYVQISRRYWGGWLSPRRWGLEASYRRHAAHVHDRARHHARRAEAARLAGNRLLFVLERLATWRYAPRMARERLSRR